MWLFNATSIRRSTALSSAYITWLLISDTILHKSAQIDCLDSQIGCLYQAEGANPLLPCELWKASVAVDDSALASMIPSNRHTSNTGRLQSATAMPKLEHIVVFFIARF